MCTFFFTYQNSEEISLKHSETRETNVLKYLLKSIKHKHITFDSKNPWILGIHWLMKKADSAYV